MPQRVMKSIHEFNEFLSANLTIVRNLRYLSGHHPYFVRYDELMSECWSSTINGRCPTPEQRRAATFDQITPRDVKPLLEGPGRDLVARLQMFQEYLGTIVEPVPPQGGWGLTPSFQHSEVIREQFKPAMDAIKGFRVLGLEDELFATVYDQLIALAKWLREDVCPSPGERAQFTAGGVTPAQMDAHLDAAIACCLESLHDFNRLYVNFPVLPPMPKIHLEPIGPFRGRGEQ